jgi:hypothetical protein
MILFLSKCNYLSLVTLYIKLLFQCRFVTSILEVSLKIEIKVEIVLVILILKISWGYHSSNHIWIGFMIHKFIYTCEFDYTNGMVYTLIIQLYVIKFVSDLWRSMVFEHYKIIETLLKVH